MLPPSFTPEYLRTMELLKLRARRAYLGTRQGGHLSPKRGHGIEFSDYRKYELGDNPRHIDWGVYGRSDRLYVKRFQEEQELTVMIVLDTSNSMRTPTGKWEKARDIALSLAYIALLEQDTVVLSAPGYLTSPHYHGGRAFHHIGKTLMELEPTGIQDLVSGVHRSISSVGFPGVAIFISDLLIPFEQTRAICNSMRAKNFDTTVIQVLSSEDLDPLSSEDSAVAVDSETGKEVPLSLNSEFREDYSVLLKEHNEKLADYFAGTRIGYAQTRAEDPLRQTMTEKLAKVGLLQ